MEQQPYYNQAEPLNQTQDSSSQSKSLQRKLKKHHAAIEGFNCDKQKYGNGLVKNRRMTDVAFFILFGVFVVGLAGMGFYNIYKGDPKKLFAPQDANRHLCGFDDVVKDYPLVYWTLGVNDPGKTENQNIFSSAICVKECPENDQDHLECHSTTDVPNCEKVTPYASVKIFKMCFPKDVDDLPPQLKEKWNQVKDEIQSGNSGKVIEDLENSWKDIVICLITAMVYSLLYMYAMSIFPTAIAYVAIFFIELVFVVGGAAFIFYSFKTDKHDLKQSYMITGAVFLLFGMIFNCLMYCYWSKLKEGIAIIDATADFFVATKRIIFVSLFQFFWQAVLTGYCIAVLVCICASQDISVDPASKTLQGKNIVFSRAGQIFCGVLLFGWLWIQIYLSNTTVMTCMCSASTYYFNSNANHTGSADVVKSIWWSNWTHAGSVALGSLMMAIIRLLKIIAESKGNGEGNAVGKCIACCLACLEDVVDYINIIAYANMAVSGDSFCTSAWNGFILNLKHCVKFYFAETLAGMFVFIGYLFVISANIITLFLVMKYGTKSYDNIQYQAVPYGIIMFSSLITATLFIGLFSKAVVATLQSMAIDRDVHDGETKFGPPSYHKKLRAIYGDSYGKPVQHENQNQVFEEAPNNRERNNSLV